MHYGKKISLKEIIEIMIFFTAYSLPTEKLSISRLPMLT